MTTATKPQTQKFYRSVLQVEILSEEPLLDDMTLQDVYDEINAGPCSGLTNWVVSNQPKTGKQMAKLLQAQGSDPEFFQIDAEGKPLEPWDGSDGE